MALTQISSGGVKDDSIVNADIKSDAAIDLTKLNSGSLPNGIAVNQQNIAAGQLVTGHIAAGTGFQISNSNVSDSAAIAGSKFADDSITEVKLDVHNAPSGTDKFLAYTSNGMEWAVPTDTNTQLSTEEVQDIVGAMFTGNTETNITATYEDSDGTIDLVSTDTTTPADGTVTEAKLNANAPTNDHVLTADSTAAGGFKWAAASGGAALTGSTNNTVCTVTGANAIQGEANLTFDGSKLLLGTTTEGYSSADDFTIETAGHTGITIRSGTSSEGAIMFSDGTSGADEYRGFIQYKHSNDNIDVGVNSVEKIRIHTDGTTSFASGIGLGNALTYAASNTLDDYEEGTWTPTFDGASNFNYDGSNSNGEYVKIGSMVHIRCYIGFGNPALTAGGQSWGITVGGLPFTPSVSGYGNGVISVRCNSIGTYSLGSYIFGVVDGSQAKIYLKVSSSSTTISDASLTAAHIGNYSSFALQGTYHLTGG